MYNGGVGSSGGTALQERACNRGRFRLILASRSPRRRELVRALDLSVTAVTPAVAEDAPRAGEGAEDYALRTALAKARSVRPEEGTVVLGADTVVSLEGRLLGKPGSPEEARQTLRLLNGRSHRVTTALALVSPQGVATDVCNTLVRFRRYSDAELEAYVATGDPMDKAGAYGIQHPVFRPAEAVDGCRLNVVGLPLCRLSELLGRLLSLSSFPHPAADKTPYACPQCRLPGAREVAP